MELRPTDLLRHVTEAREAQAAREQALDDEPFHTAPVTPSREDERRAGPGESDPPDPPGTTPDVPERHAPTRPARGTLIADWREGPQADLSDGGAPPADVDEDQDRTEDEVPEAPAADRDDHDDEPGEPEKDKPEKKGRAKRASKTTPAEEAPGEDEPEEDDEAEDDEPWENDGAEERPARRTYRRPRYREKPLRPRESGLQWWRGLKNKQRAGTYVITAFGAGVLLQLPQFVSRQAVYLRRTYDGFDPNHIVWGSVVVATFWLHWRTRHMWPPFAWAGCVPLVSLCSGLLLYGPPVGALDQFRDLVLSLV
ncbi:hypothetical protein [Embleya sp. NPDC001921]